MDRRKLLPALLLVTALAVTSTAVMAKEHGGHECAQHEKHGQGHRDARDDAAGRGDAEISDDKSGGWRPARSAAMVAEIRITCSSRTRVTTSGENGVPYLKR